VEPNSALIGVKRLMNCILLQSAAETFPNSIGDKPKQKKFRGGVIAVFDLKVTDRIARKIRNPKSISYCASFGVCRVANSSASNSVTKKS
jgi:hypothetical protein